MSFSVTSGSGTFTARLVGSTGETDGRPIKLTDDNLANVGENFTVNAEKAGYTFVGWYNGETELTKSSGYTFILPNEDITYTAKWIVCPVTLEKSIAQAGSVSMPNTSTVGQNTTITATTNSGYTWVGWYNGETELTKEHSYTFAMPSINVTYTAKWIKVTVDRSNTSAGGVTSLTDKYNVGDSVTINATTNSGYTWAGWYDATTKLTDELSYTFVMPSVNKTYTAKWEERREYLDEVFEYTLSDGKYTITGIKDKNVTSISVPGYVNEISQGAFSGCANLTTITLPFVGGTIKTSSDTYQYPFGYIFGTSSYTGGTAITQYYYVSSISGTTSKTYYIPTTLKNVTITGGNLLYGAFYNCSSLTGIMIPNSVTSIGGRAFNGCSSLTSITIPSSVTSIGSSAFYNCSSLTNITIPNSVTSIGNDAFRDCSGLTSITIPNSVTSIESYAFFGCSSLTSITIPDSVTNIENLAFYNCSSLTSITIPSSVTGIGISAFDGCSGLTSITIPSSVTSIGSSAFYNCSSLTSIEIPNSVTSIGDNAFRGCSSLTSIEIPNSVTTIGTHAFYNCNKLTIYCEATSKPSGWDSGWNYSGRPVVWDCKNK